MAIKMATMMESTSVSIQRNWSEVAGISTSTVYTSFENLFSIRPRGVVSKKRMGALRSLSNMVLWRTREARISATTIEKVARKERTV